MATLVMRTLSNVIFKSLATFYIVAGVVVGSGVLLTDNNIIMFLFHLWATMVPFFLLAFLMGVLSS